MIMRMPKSNGSNGLPGRVLRNAADMLRTLSHPVRLRIVEQLMSGERTVSELIDLTRQPQHIVSQHLRELRRVKVVSGKRDGRFVRYSLTSPDAAGVIMCIQRHHTANASDVVMDGAAI